MKKFLLTVLISFFIGGVYSQDTLHTNVYQKINTARLIFDLNTLQVDENLELASAHHGCWIALYNLDKDTITTPSGEFKASLSTTLFETSDRIKNYTDREFTYCKDTTIVLRQEPNTHLIINELFKTGLLLDVKSKYCGFWVVKFEDKFEVPVWYLVFTISD